MSYEGLVLILCGLGWWWINGHLILCGRLLMACLIINSIVVLVLGQCHIWVEN